MTNNQNLRPRIANIPMHLFYYCPVCETERDGEVADVTVTTSRTENKGWMREEVLNLVCPVCGSYTQYSAWVPVRAGERIVTDELVGEVNMDFGDEEQFDLDDENDKE